MGHRTPTGVTRRYQSPRTLRRRLFRAYCAMERQERMFRKRMRNGMYDDGDGWSTMLGGPAYYRWERVRAHMLVCKHITPAPYRLLALDDVGRDVEIDPLLEAAE